MAISSIKKCIFVLCIATVVCAAQQNFQPDGIVQLQSGTIVILSTRHDCELESHLRHATALVSQDGGDTWETSNVAVEDSEFTLFQEAEGQLWAAGSWMTEGPGPSFIARYDEAQKVWTSHVIYRESSVVEDMYLSPDGVLLAEIRHYDRHLNPTKLVTRTSRDGGKSWQRGEAAQDVKEGGRRFKPLSMDSATARLLDDDDGFRLQLRISPITAWKTVKHFPRVPCISPPE